MGKESWAKSIAEESPYKFVYPAFLEHISPIGIEPNHVKGRVLVIGQASAFPEKTLVATPESGFNKLRNEVDAVYCCDTYYPFHPELHIETPWINTIFSEQVPSPEPNTSYYELSSSYSFLPRVKPEFFDTALMFRVVDTGTQIQKLGLIKSIAPHLKEGGLFICSGGRFPTNPPDDFYDPLELVKSVRLPDYSDGFLFTQNTGVILKKESS